MAVSNSPPLSKILDSPLHVSHVADGTELQSTCYVIAAQVCAEIRRRDRHLYDVGTCHCQTLALADRKHPSGAAAGLRGFRYVIRDVIND